MTSTSRTARCGPACRVVWQGRSLPAAPYADLKRQEMDAAGGVLVNRGRVAKRSSDRHRLYRLCRIGSPDETIRPDVLHMIYGCEVVVDAHPQTGRPRVTMPMNIARN